MIELNRNHSLSQARNDLDQLQERANQRRDRLRQQSISISGVYERLTALSASSGQWLKKLPTRYLFHTIVALTVPTALALGQLSVHQAPTPATAEFVQAELPIAIGPIDLETADSVSALVGDPPLDEDDAMPIPLSLTSRSAALAPLVVPAAIAGDVVKLRNGPGLDYDDVGRINGGSIVEVLGRHNEWLQIRDQPGAPLYWVASELVDMPEATMLTLNLVPDTVIPPPPPPKIGTVIEDNVNLRDGPGTNYVSMAKMSVTQDLTLIEQYNGWFLVEYGEVYGWVSGDLLTIGPGVLDRVAVANSIPDPNPPLIGTVLENKVNLRKGPGSAYDRIGSIDAGAPVDLVARHKDWYKVSLSNGSTAWIFSDLLDVTPMARRRVPVTNNIPALPVKNRPVAGRSGPVNIPASGDVAGFAVQFVGSRYTWGGSSPAGFDCSGLTRYVYRQFGVGLPHSAAAQFSTRYGAMIGGMGNLAPGDLVFFANTGGRRGISHVALYIGGGQIVHAMTPRYGVQVSALYTSYWQSHYVGAIRPYR